MKYLPLLLLLTILASSCSTYQATTKKQENLQYETVRVFPEWKYKDPKARKWIAPIVCVSAAAAYGYNNETTIGEETYSGTENAGIWAGGGLVAALIVNAVLFPKKNYQKTKYDSSQSEKWLENFNKTTKNDYLIQNRESDKTLVLVERSRIESLRKPYTILLSDLKKPEPITTFKVLQDWKQKLKGRYSILPKSEINLVSNAITNSEPKIANRELKQKASEMTAIADDYDSLGKLSSFMGQNRNLYNAADANSRESVDKTINNKLSEVLTKTLGEEMTELNKIGKNLDQVQALDAFYRRFDDKYRGYKVFTKVADAYKKVIENKTSVIRQSEGNINTKIKAATSLAQLKSVEQQYFSNLDRKDFVVEQLFAQVRIRRSQIIEEEKQRELSEMRRIAALKEERKVLLRQMSTTDQDKFLNELDLATDGLYNAAAIMAIYKGDFVNVPFNRDAVSFSTLINTYANTYASYCTSSLPANKIEMTEQVCTRESVTTDGWGNEISRYCVQWKTVGTGLYASPDMYKAILEIDGIQARDALRNAWDYFLQARQDPFGHTQGFVADLQTVKSDIIALITMNGCDSPALRRFEKNLRMFALNQSPTSLGSSTSNSSKTTILSNEQNLDQLVEDLIASEAKNWVVNEYNYSSSYNVVVSSEDKYGQASELTANYLFNGSDKGKVRITFQNGMPSCLYFSDFPRTCRTADRRVVAKYVEGRYQK